MVETKFWEIGVEFKPLCEICVYSKDRILAETINAYNYVSVDNLLPNRGGKTVSDNVPEKGFLVKYEVGDVLLGNIRPYLKKIWCADISGATNGDVLVVHIEGKDTIIPKFLYYVLSSDDFFTYDTQNTKGTKMPRGDKKVIMEYEIPLFPLEEQERIASALTSIDNLISSLDKQIAKTRNIKQGVMQQLLTFPDNVPLRPLGEISEIEKGIQFNKVDMNEKGSYPVFNGGINASGYIEQYNQEGETITVSQGGASAGYVNWQTEKFWAGAHCYVVNPKAKIGNRFLYYFIKYNELTFMNSKYGGNIPALAIATLLNFLIPVPSIEEQQRIASTLTAMDNQIAALEAKRRKYEMLKQGMMQQLLTGKIRLSR